MALSSKARSMKTIGLSSTFSAFALTTLIEGKASAVKYVIRVSDGTEAKP